MRIQRILEAFIALYHIYVFFYIRIKFTSFS